MPIFTFRGRLVPEWLELTLEGSHSIDRTEEEGEQPTTYRAVVNRGRIEIAASTPNDEAEYGEFFVPVLDMARAVADVVCLESGKAFIPILDEVILPSGKTVPVVLADGTLRQIFGRFLRENFDAVLDVALTDVHVARILADATSMLTWTHYAPIAAGRIAEGIRNQLTGGREQANWASMREKLRVDRPYLQLLTDHATPPRHGDRQYVPGEVNSELAKRAWTLLERFLALRILGELDSNEYPVLQG